MKIIIKKPHSLIYCEQCKIQSASKFKTANYHPLHSDSPALLVTKSLRKHICDRQVDVVEQL